MSLPRRWYTPGSSAPSSSARGTWTTNGRPSTALRWNSRSLSRRAMFRSARRSRNTHSISAAMRASGRARGAGPSTRCRARRDRVERPAAEAGQELARQPERADARAVERRPGQGPLGGVEVSDVERGVVGDGDVVPDEVEERGEGLRDRRGVGDHLVRDAGEPRDEGRDALPGVHQRGERLREPPVDDAHGADLGDARRGGAAARRLQVEDDEARGAEGPRERLVDARAPAAGDGVVREARPGRASSRGSAARTRGRGRPRRRRGRGAPRSWRPRDARR